MANLEFVIRELRQEDVQSFHDLVNGLAVYSRQAQLHTTTCENYIRDGFGPNPFFRALVAVCGGKLVGYSVYFFTYSTWEGRSIYMEDIYVHEEYRGNGIGSAFFKRVGKIAKENLCIRLELVVDNTNEPSKQFYQRRGAMDITIEQGWHKYRFTGDALKKLDEP